MNISIFGLGYVGCVIVGCLAQDSNFVIGVDINEEKVKLINAGKPTIIEKDIDKIIHKQFKKGNIRATIDYKDAVLNSDLSIICVGTPSSENGHLNLCNVFNTAKQIGEALREKDTFHIIAIRSTVSPGTCEKYAKLIEEISGKKKNIDFTVAVNPEFLREGSAVSDYYNPPYTVIGTDSDIAFKLISEIYANINAPVFRVDVKTAEIIKYVNNAFHALKIAFSNEIGTICKKLGIDSHQVMNLFVQDSKLNISSAYFKPGFAYGGSCLPKDLKGLNTLAHDHYLNTPVLNAIHNSNEIQKEIAFDLIMKENVKRIGILGLSFKEGTDDLRYSPIVDLVERLMGKGYILSIYDKNVQYSRLIGTNKEYIEKHIPHLQKFITDDLYKVIDSSELIVIGHKLDKFCRLPQKYPLKKFIDLVRVTNEIDLPNYIGIAW